MAKADSPVSLGGQSASPAAAIPACVDLLIVGAGVMGLWAAVKADRLGISTLLIDQAHPAAGASGGLLGALMPHMPDRFNDKKQFQFDALLSLEDEVARLEAETGLPCGYRRCGRLIPLPKPHLRSLAEGHSRQAEAHWQAPGRHFFWNVLDRPPQPDWLSQAAAPSGVVEDTFAARVSPRRLTAALVQAIDAGRHVRRVDGLGVDRLEGRAAHLSNGETIAFGHVIIAAGPGSFPLLQQLGAASLPLVRPLGTAVKGQAALLKADVDPDLPVLFLNGLYVVAHEDGHVAIGSTSEDVFDAPFTTDGQLDQLIEKARALSPKLHDAEIVERWAGLRPKAIDRDPMVGPHPDFPHVIALTGGFKVSFGLAHRLADAALAATGGTACSLPASFALSHHLEVAQTQK
ncbi:NAD(P)/FAD-dependent oxidoreductase [Rhizobium sp. SGZ-381]|uniref:NAD(P)/FAD-dependent oxidoreductase n=1 Tax=Rhizobium sp. SGZ-381 TaxID=3342800 RepID=UPI00366BA1A8